MNPTKPFFCQTVEPCSRALYLYRPDAKPEEISSGRVTAWAVMSQERDLPTLPWNPVELYSNTPTFKKPEDVAAYFAGMTEMRDSHAAWMCGNPAWEAPEKFRALKPGEEIALGDVLVIGDFRTRLVVDRMTPKKAWSDAYSFPRIVPEDFRPSPTDFPHIKYKQVHALRPLT